MYVIANTRATRMRTRGSAGARARTRARAMSTTVALRHARRCAKTLFARTAARANTAASQASIDAFMEKFDVAKTSPTMDRPSTPTTFASAPVEESAKGTADKLKLNFYLPHEVAHDKEEVRERCETRWDGDRPMGLRPTSGRRGFDPNAKETRANARRGRGSDAARAERSRDGGMVARGER